MIWMFKDDISNQMESVGFGGKADDPDWFDNLTDEQQTVINFYDKRIIPFLEQLKPNSIVTDLGDEGEWLAIPITKEDATNPIIAYQILGPVAGAGAL